MTKIFFLIIYICCFLFSCSDLLVEENTDPDKSRSDPNKKESKSELDRDNKVAKSCKGNGYTIYSYDECPSETEIRSSLVGQSKRPVDILFVLDTSQSMYFYLNQGFKSRFKKFISIINNLNWRILFTNAGYSTGFFSFFNHAMNGEAMKLENADGVLKLKYLDRSVAFYEDVFRYTITRDPKREVYDREDSNNDNECSFPPYCQGAEQPIRALQASFAANKHLTRKEADFVAIIISNTDENPETDSRAIKVEDIMSEFKKVYGSQKRLSVLSLIILPGDVNCKNKNDKHQFWFPESNPASQIALLAQKTGGGNFSICLKDYSIVAETIVQLNTQ